MLTVQYAKDPVWGNEAHTMINLIVKFVELPNELPFTANPNDNTTYGPALYNESVAGDFGPIGPYVPPPEPPVA